MHKQLSLPYKRDVFVCLLNVCMYVLVGPLFCQETQFENNVKLIFMYRNIQVIESLTSWTSNQSLFHSQSHKY